MFQMQQELEVERDELVNKLYSVDQKLQEVMNENKHLSDQVNVDKQTISQLQKEAKDLIMVREEVQQRADNVTRVCMKMKRYGMNVREIALQPQEKTEGIYKSRGLHEAFNKGGIPLLVNSSKLLQKKNVYM